MGKPRNDLTQTKFGEKSVNAGPEPGYIFCALLGLVFFDPGSKK